MQLQIYGLASFHSERPHMGIIGGGVGENLPPQHDGLGPGYGQQRLSVIVVYSMDPGKDLSVPKPQLQLMAHQNATFEPLNSANQGSAASTDRHKFRYQNFATAGSPASLQNKRGAPVPARYVR